jgi:hypothetical protein
VTSSDSHDAIAGQFRFDQRSIVTNVLTASTGAPRTWMTRSIHLPQLGAAVANSSSLVSIAFR